MTQHTGTPRSTSELLAGPQAPKPQAPIFDDEYPADLLPAPRPGRSQFPDIFVPGGDE